jgi:hypothetical protein
MQTPPKNLLLVQSVHFHKSEQEIVEFVHLNTITGVLITCETITYKAGEPATSHIIFHHFKARTGWCVHMTWRNGFSLRRRTLLWQKLPSDCKEKLASFQQHVIELKKRTNTS